MLSGAVKNEEKSVTKVFSALGTVNSIFVPFCSDKSAVDSAAKRVAEIDGRMSAFNEESDIFKINENAGIEFVSLHPDTAYVLKRAIYFSEISFGAFDITAAPLVCLWGIGKKGSFIPEIEQIEETRRLVGYKNIIFDKTSCSVMLRRKGQRIDLGGIAKGYAADEAKRILLSYGIKNALINLGGNIISMGLRSDGRPWVIGVQDPTKERGMFLGTIELNDETAVTSGSNEQYFVRDGRVYHHILDPVTGMPANKDILSVTAIGGCSTDMDALTTAAFVLGAEKGAQLLLKFNAQAVFVLTDRSVYITGGLKDRFSFSKDIQNNKGG